MFCAYSLIRSFAESALKEESDAYVAVTQCAALSCGLEWKGDKTGIEILQRCWTTVVEHVIQKGWNLSFSMRRKRENDWTAGLTKVLPVIQAKLRGGSLEDSIGSSRDTKKEKRSIVGASFIAPVEDWVRKTYGENTRNVKAENKVILRIHPRVAELSLDGVEKVNGNRDECTIAYHLEGGAVSKVLISHQSTKLHSDLVVSKMNDLF